MKKNSKIKIFSYAVFGTLITFSFYVNTFAVTQHSIPNDAADSYNDIDYGGTTKYSTYVTVAATKWNNVVSNAPINISADTALTLEDVTLSDVNKSTVTWFGLTSFPSSGCTIQFNDYLMDEKNLSSDRRKAVVLHEFGHTVGVGDQIESTYNQSVMYAYADGPYLNLSFSSHDIADYKLHWGFK